MDTNQLAFNKNIALSVFLSIVLVGLLPLLSPALIFAVPDISGVQSELEGSIKPYGDLVKSIFNIALPIVIFGALGIAVISYVFSKNMGRMMMFLVVVAVGSIVWASKSAFIKMFGVT